jgi:hypothetical protein
MEGRKMIRKRIKFVMIPHGGMIRVSLRQLTSMPPLDAAKHYFSVSHFSVIGFCSSRLNFVKSSAAGLSRRCVCFAKARLPAKS